MKDNIVETAKDTAIDLVSAGVGAMASRVGAAYVPGGAYGKLAASIVIGGLSIKSRPKSFLGKQAKWAGIGASVVQFTEGLVEVIRPVVAQATEGKTGMLVDGLKKTVGLAAADTSFYEELLERQALAEQNAFMPEAPLLTASNPAGA